MLSEPCLRTTALCQSLIDGPLLVDDLPGVDAFTYKDLSLPADLTPLNFRQKLGHICEDALAVLLEADPRHELLERNLQIQKDAHHTVGELDFLLRELDSGQLIHLELATKFYLAVESADGLALPGPDARDNYAKKLGRLCTHQLLLPTRYQSYFPGAYKEAPIVTQHLIYGCLFDHIHAKQPAAPEFSNPTARRGRWLRIDELATHFPPDRTFEVIPKPLWLVPPERLDNLSLAPWSPDDTMERCVMLRVKGETVPYFVAPVGYPDHVRVAAD